MTKWINYHANAWLINNENATMDMIETGLGNSENR